MKTFLFTLLLAGPMFFTDTQAQNTNRAGVTIPTLEINLYARAMNGTMFLADGVLQNFNNIFSPAVDNMDVRKFMNISDNLAIKNGTYNLIVERRPVIRITDTVRLMLTGTRIAPYRFVIDPSVLNYPTIRSVLKDKYLGTETAVSMTAVTTFNFDITTDPLSRAADRFMIVYRNVDPVRFTRFTASRNTDKTISATFNTENENNINTYTIERSNDGTTYEALAEQMPTANNFGNPYYNYRDVHATLNAQWYRVKANGISGTPIYSMAVKIDMVNEKSIDVITVYPNPVINGIINIGFTEQLYGAYTIQVINGTGQIIHTEKINIQSDNLQKKMTVAGMKSGIYRLLMTDVNGKKLVKTILAK